MAGVKRTVKVEYLFSRYSDHIKVKKLWLRIISICTLMRMLNHNKHKVHSNWVWCSAAHHIASCRIPIPFCLVYIESVMMHAFCKQS